MNTEDELAAAFDLARSRLIRVAYAVLGTHAEAQDVVSECWLRLAAANQQSPIVDVDAWSTVAVARLALDTLRSARVRRETYVGPWLPEPIIAQLDVDPADRVTLDDSISFAMMVVLESLSPAERSAWVLHDLFGMGFAAIGEIVGRSPAAVRQLATRARKHVSDRAPRFDVDAEQHRAAFSAFAAAAGGGSLTAMISILDPAVVLTSDGGGKVSAARRPVVGADQVARFILGLMAKAVPDREVHPVLVNGSPGYAVVDSGQVTTVVSLTVVDGLITRVDMIRTPDKLPR